MKVVDAGVCNFAPGGQENELAKDPCYPVNNSSDFITSTPYTQKSKIKLSSFLNQTSLDFCNAQLISFWLHSCPTYMYM